MQDGSLILLYVYVSLCFHLSRITTIRIEIVFFPFELYSDKTTCLLAVYNVCLSKSFDKLFFF